MKNLKELLKTITEGDLNDHNKHHEKENIKNILIYESILLNLKERLQSAALLELSTIPPYLTAYYSTSKNVNVLMKVAIDEMKHLRIVSRVLNSIGGKVDFNSQNIPVYPLTMKFDGESKFKKPWFTDTEFEVSLRGYDDKSLDVFLQIERPDDLPKPELKLAIQGDYSKFDGYTIGEFYDIILLLLDLLEKYHFKCYGLPFDFLNEYEKDGLEGVKKDIKIIMEEGEGSSIEHMENSHYGTFLKLKAEYNDSKAGKKLIENPSQELYETKYAEKPQLAQLNKECNKIYTDLLKTLMNQFNSKELIPSFILYGTMPALEKSILTLMEQIVEKDGVTYYGSPSYEWEE